MKDSTRAPLPSWLLFLVGIFGALFVQRSTSLRADRFAPTTSAPAAVAVAPKEITTPHFAQPLFDFLGFTEGELAELRAIRDSREQKGAQDKLLQPRIAAQIGHLDFLVFVVADPLDAQANHRFDVQIDTLHKALSADSYVPDRYYLPWTVKVGEKPHRTTPGLLLYRRNDGSTHSAGGALTDILLVYLVGETPTAGIHTAAFATAVAHQIELRKLCERSQLRTDEVAVCGPTFSGSGDSLARSIGAFKQRSGHDCVGFTVITGHATSIDQRRFKNLSKGTDLESTVLHGELLKRALIGHVLERNWSPPRIAWLTETGTGFGSSISFHGNQQAHPGSQDSLEVIEFPFPANISRVRAAYENSRHKERESQALPSPTQPRLPIPISVADGATDLAPALTPDVTAPTAELVLGQILATIRKQGIDYVGISATDPRDPLFIAGIIKEQCPNVQIMLVTSDVLQLHPEYGHVMHGSLVASTYPLYPEAITWCFPYGEHREGTSRNIVLSHQGMYGIYNAITILRAIQANTCVLDHDKHSVSLRGKIQAYPIVYGAPFDERKTEIRPPVWISRVGSTGFHPITSKHLPPAISKAECERLKIVYHDDYTLSLDLTKVNKFPPMHVHTRIPLSLVIVALVWLTGAGMHLAVVGYDVEVGKWSRPFKVPTTKILQFKQLALVFRSLATTCYMVMLGLLGAIAIAGSYSINFSESFVASTFIMAEVVLSFSLFAWLGLILRRDLWSAIGGVADPSSSDSRLQKHMSRARIVGIVVIVLLLGTYLIVAATQLAKWGQWRVDAFIWFATSSDMWNGLSFLTTVQFPAVAILILVYGMLSQLHFLSRDRSVVIPRLLNIARPDQLVRIRDGMLFPILARFHDKRSVVLSVISIVLVIVWLIYLGNETQSPDFFALPINFPCLLWLFAVAFWFVRFVKVINILQDFCRAMRNLADKVQARWRTSWDSMFQDAHVQRNGLEELFWDFDAYSSAADDHLRQAEQSYSQSTELGAPRDNADRQLCALEIDLFVRRNFYHFGRLAFGLIASGILLFLAAQSFPLSSEPLLRMTSSLMLAACGGMIVWYYVQFDRDEVLSRLVGTDPKRVAWNWSMLQSVAPGLLLTAIAFVSQAFPDVWLWLRHSLEPLLRSS